jgi:hypothetical protein
VRTQVSPNICSLNHNTILLTCVFESASSYEYMSKYVVNPHLHQCFSTNGPPTLTGPQLLLKGSASWVESALVCNAVLVHILSSFDHIVCFHVWLRDITRKTIPSVYILVVYILLNLNMCGNFREGVRRTRYAEKRWFRPSNRKVLLASMLLGMRYAACLQNFNLTFLSPVGSVKVRGDSHLH